MVAFLCKNLPLPPAILQYHMFLSDLLNNFIVFIQICAPDLIQGNNYF